MWMIESNGEEKPWAGVCCLYCSIENGWEMMIIIKKQNMCVYTVYTIRHIEEKIIINNIFFL